MLTLASNKLNNSFQKLEINFKMFFNLFLKKLSWSPELKIKTVIETDDEIIENEMIHSHKLLPIKKEGLIKKKTRVLSLNSFGNESFLKRKLATFQLHL